MDARQQSEKNLIFRCLTGSRAYGTNNEHSDTDVRGVFAADPISLMTPFYPVEQVEGPGDTVLYELSKYVRLVVDQNPNIVELLWIEPEDVQFEAAPWRLLRDQRARLLTTKVAVTYGGFAAQALKQMKGRDRWLNKPQPVEPPQQRDFMTMVHNFSIGRSPLEVPQLDTLYHEGLAVLAPSDGREFNSRLPEDGNWTAVSIKSGLFLLYAGGSGTWFDAQGQLRVFTHEQAGRYCKGVPAAIVNFNQAEYDSRKRDHTHYWTWIRERNQERGAMEAKLGYDAKSGAHLIRILRTAKEILTEGVVRVRRPDAPELLAIRRGELAYEQISDMANELNAELPSLVEKSSLPAAVDKAMVGQLVMEMYERTWEQAVHRTQSVVPRDLFLQAHVPDVRGRIVILDLEMSGYADDGCYQVVEIAAIEIMGGLRTGRTFHAYVNPESKINPHATAIHGLTNDFLSGQQTFAQIQPKLMAFFANSPIVSHDAASDLRALNNDLRLSGVEPIGPGRVACSKRIAARLLYNGAMSLDTLCDAFSVDRRPRTRGHSAILDAALLSEAFLKMAKLPGYPSAKDVWITKTEVGKKHSGTARDTEEDLDRTMLPRPG
jgi:DNA polymerase III epsilon subunit